MPIHERIRQATFTGHYYCPLPVIPGFVVPLFANPSQSNDFFRQIIDRAGVTVGFESVQPERTNTGPTSSTIVSIGSPAIWMFQYEPGSFLVERHTTFKSELAKIEGINVGPYLSWEIAQLFGNVDEQASESYSLYNSIRAVDPVRAEYWRKNLCILPTIRERLSDSLPKEVLKTAPSDFLFSLSLTPLPEGVRLDAGNVANSWMENHRSDIERVLSPLSALWQAVGAGGKVLLPGDLHDKAIENEKAIPFTEPLFPNLKREQIHIIFGRNWKRSIRLAATIVRAVAQKSNTQFALVVGFPSAPPPALMQIPNVFVYEHDLEEDKFVAVRIGSEPHLTKFRVSTRASLQASAASIFVGFDARELARIRSITARLNLLANQFYVYRTELEALEALRGTVALPKLTGPSAATIVLLEPEPTTAPLDRSGLLTATKARIRHVGFASEIDPRGMRQYIQTGTMQWTYPTTPNSVAFLGVSDRNSHILAKSWIEAGLGRVKNSKSRRPRRGVEHVAYIVPDWRFSQLVRDQWDRIDVPRISIRQLEQGALVDTKVVVAPIAYKWFGFMANFPGRVVWFTFSNNKVLRSWRTYPMFLVGNEEFSTIHASGTADGSGALANAILRAMDRAYSEDELYIKHRLDHAGEISLGEDRLAAIAVRAAKAFAKKIFV